MTSMTNLRKGSAAGPLRVVHPLDDVPEMKMDVSILGPMPMTASVRLSLLALRAYLVLMACLVLSRFVDLL